MGLVAEMVARPGRALDPAREGPAAHASDEAERARKDVLAPGQIPGATDDLLVRAAVAGQREAFSELVGRYTNMVLWFTNARLRDPVEAEEVTQAAMVTAFVELPKLRAPRAFANWLLTIANSMISKKRRRESRLIRLEEPDGVLGADGAPGPPERLSDEEIRERLVLEMQKLPQHYGVVLALKYLNGYSVEDIASRIQVPQGTVRARLSRAYGMLRQRLAPAILGKAAPPPPPAAQGPSDGEASAD